MSTKTGWCMTGDCDTAERRGGCPVVAGSNPPCICECHQGSDTARPYLPVVAAAPQLWPAEPEAVSEPPHAA